MTSIKENISIFQVGKKNSLPVIFVHGFPYDHNMWENQIDKLKSKYNCITYDIRGLGKSNPGDGQYTMESFVDDLEAVMEETGVIKPVLCGLSMGGYISLRAVEKMEEKFSGLILCDTKSNADTNEVKLNRAADVKKINSEGVKNFTREFIRKCFTADFMENHSDKFTEIIENSAQYSPVGLKGCLLAMAGRTDTTVYLSQIKIPTLVVCGEEDRLTPPDTMKKLSGMILSSKFHTIPGAAHMSPVENPNLFNKYLLDFLNNNFG